MGRGSYPRTRKQCAFTCYPVRGKQQLQEFQGKTWQLDVQYQHCGGFGRIRSSRPAWTITDSVKRRKGEEKKGKTKDRREGMSQVLCY